DLGVWPDRTAPWTTFFPRRPGGAFDDRRWRTLLHRKKPAAKISAEGAIFALAVAVVRPAGIIQPIHRSKAGAPASRRPCAPGLAHRARLGSAAGAFPRSASRAHRAIIRHESVRVSPRLPVNRVVQRGASNPGM